MLVFYSFFSGQTEDCWVGDTQLSSHGVDWRKPLEGTFNRPFPPSYDEAVSSTNTGETHLEDPGNPAPPYQGPVLPYQVATLGRRVFPVGIDSTSTLPSVLRRIRRNTPDRDERVNEPEPEWVRPEVRINLHSSSTRHSNPLFRHSLQICSGYSGKQWFNPVLGSGSEFAKIGGSMDPDPRGEIYLNF